MLGCRVPRQPAPTQPPTSRTPAPPPPSHQPHQIFRFPALMPIHTLALVFTRHGGAVRGPQSVAELGETDGCWGNRRVRVDALRRARHGRRRGGVGACRPKASIGARIPCRVRPAGPVPRPRLPPARISARVAGAPATANQLPTHGDRFAYVATAGGRLRTGALDFMGNRSSPRAAGTDQLSGRHGPQPGHRPVFADFSPGVKLRRASARCLH